MDNKSITFTAVGACSYAWNKGEYKKDGFCMRIGSSIVALLRAIFRNYSVCKAEVDGIYQDHPNSIFGKEYYKVKIENREIKNNSVNTNEHEITPTKKQDKAECIAKKQEESPTAEETVLNDPETKLSVSERNDLSSLLQGKEIKKYSEDEFRKLMLTDNFSDDIHYVVEGAIVFDSKKREEKIYLPKFITVTGVFSIDGQNELKTFPEVLIVKGSFATISNCGGLNDLSATHLRVDGDLHIDHCEWITFLPNDIAVNKCVDITKCPNLKKLPDLFEYHKLYVMWCFKLLNVLGNGFATAFEKIKDDTKKRVE